MRKPISIAVKVEAPRDSLDARLESLAAPLRTLEPAEVIARFELPSESQLLKTTLSLCAVCLAHVPAAVYTHEGRVFMRKRCDTHGAAMMNSVSEIVVTVRFLKC